jgi:hypothetical protein
MEERTWRRRLQELHTKPRPREIDPIRLRQQAAQLRHELLHPLRLDPVYAGWRGVSAAYLPRRQESAPDLGGHAKLARIEIELALLERGIKQPAKRKSRTQRHKKVDKS